MENPFKNLSRTSLPRQSEKMKKEIRVLYDDPIIISHEPPPADELPAQPENNASSLTFLIGGSIVALCCLWWLAPEWLGTA